MFWLKGFPEMRYYSVLHDQLPPHLASAARFQIRYAHKGLVGAARPPSLLAGASLKYFTARINHLL